MENLKISTYHIPITVVIEARNADQLIRRIGETIHNAISDLIAEPDFNNKIAYFDMQYSLHKKMLDEDFK